VTSSDWAGFGATARCGLRRGAAVSAPGRRNDSFARKTRLAPAGRDMGQPPIAAARHAMPVLGSQSQAEISTGEPNGLPRRTRLGSRLRAHARRARPTARRNFRNAAVDAATCVTRRPARGSAFAGGRETRRWAVFFDGLTCSRGRCRRPDTVTTTTPPIRCVAASCVSYAGWTVDVEHGARARRCPRHVPFRSLTRANTR